jgi:DNA-directed RNA polymerase sigma subunit (sigma70/sigma32)
MSVVALILVLHQKKEEIKMEENTNPTSNHPVLFALNNKITELTELNVQHEETLKNLWQALGMMTTNVEALEDWLKEALSISGQIDFDTATEIAEIFGFSLTEEVEMELTFKVQATFNVPIGFDHDKLAEDFGITENPLGVAEEYLENSHWELDDWQITS